jgi:hypothetical protein
MAPRPRARQATQEARFVFQGTVRKLKAATLAAVPVSDRTVVVRVDRVIHAPETLVDYAGRDITVQLAPGESVAPGNTLIFHANGWIFAEGLAVQSVGHEAATTPKVAALSTHPEDPVRNLRAREAMDQAARADLVVTGRVAAVRLPAGEAKARAMAGGPSAERISEHAPLWQEAVIDVDEVHKGSRLRKQVVVRFPSSTDVRWHRAPKFHAGQEGVFMLHRQQLPPARAKAAGLAKAHEQYTALDPGDFQPLEQLPQIQLTTRAGAARRASTSAKRLGGRPAGGRKAAGRRVLPRRRARRAK